MPTNLSRKNNLYFFDSSAYFESDTYYVASDGGGTQHEPTVSQSNGKQTVWHIPTQRLFLCEVKGFGLIQATSPQHLTLNF